jgi:D-glycero-D-manno-heptose 1,7-bisphosphate phosphatase
VKRALFLDRDGVINEDRGYVSRQEDFSFCEGVFEALRTFQAEGFLLIVVTNQSGIGRGYYTEAAYQKLTYWMLKKLKEVEIFITKVYHCPHAPETKCACRKPQPGMLQTALQEFDIDPTRSWLVGDKESDLEAAARAGVQGRIHLFPKGEKNPQLLFDTIPLILGKKEEA